MSFFKKLFGRATPDKVQYVKAMAEMAAESERTYRGMIETYNSDVKLGLLSAPSRSTVAPTGRGIYKARLFGALFMVMAYVKSTQSDSEAGNMEMMNMATGAALEPLQGQDEPRLDREEAKSFTMPYLTSTFKAMVAAFEAGPFLPGSAQREHLALADHLDDALAESIGPEYYTTEVRERFAVIVQGNTAIAMNHAGRWMLA
ncbi:MAG: hypothetical protein WEB58_13345 [Planctomycetaceae bacterium]